MAFSHQTFDLLGKLKSSGEYSFYKDNESDFKKHLIVPFKDLLTQEVVPQLPVEILDAMETQHRIFGQINKNDFGQGGAYPYYWGALYPKRSQNKQHDFQLLTFIEEEYLEYGFFQGWETSEERQRLFRDNCRKLIDAPQKLEHLLQFLDEYCPAEEFVLRNPPYPESDYEMCETGSLVRRDGDFAWPGFFSVVAESPIEDVEFWSPMTVLPAELVIEMTLTQLGESIAAAFEGVFPLMLLATSEIPFPALRSYIEAIRLLDVE